MSARRFMLYFDVNKTIMMSDPAASIPMHDMISSIISECVWGTVKEGEQKSWEMNSATPSYKPPSEEMISYGEFLENVLKVTKSERRHLKTNFTEPGFVGEACRTHYLKLLAKMEDIPSSQVIMPAFFHLMLELERKQIVFRTFGSDSTEIAREFNEFCNGTHHFCTENEYLPNLSRKCVDMDSSIGKITRGYCDEGLETYSLQFGSSLGNNAIVNGCENIYRHVMAAGTLVVQDDYPFWHGCGETDHSGKLLIIDPDTENDKVVQIFFDDNVERDRAHIIDVRKLPDLEKVSFEDANDKLYFRVSPFDIIMDHSYYINVFYEVLARRNICL